MIKLPSTEKCFELMDKYDMPEHIKSHSFKVRDISVLLAKELNEKGEELNVELVEVSALLHDIAKIKCIKSGGHDKAGAEILRNMGYDRVADIVEQHVDLWKDYEKITEEDIVNYSDKRVMHDKIVSLSERFEDIEERYISTNRATSEQINFTKQQTYRLEKKIFKYVDFSPDDLIKLLEK